MLLFLVPLMIYVVVVGVLAGLVAWRWRQRASWRPWERAAGLAPFLLWMGLVLADDHGKTLSNVVVEPVCLAVAVAVIAACRAALAPRVGPTRAATWGVVLSLSAAVLVWWVVPGLPE